MSRNERRIRRAAALVDCEVVRCQYSRPVMVEMGDIHGGWFVTLRRVGGGTSLPLGGLTAEDVLARIRAIPTLDELTAIGMEVVRGLMDKYPSPTKEPLGSAGE